MSPQLFKEDLDLQTASPKQETILLVEDDPGARTMLAIILHCQGYTVLEASDADEAVRTCKEQPQPMHLLLTDIEPRSDKASALAVRLQVLHPEMQVLFLADALPDGLPWGCAVLQKPFRLDSLARTIGRLLARGNAGAPVAA